MARLAIMKAIFFFIGQAPMSQNGTNINLENVKAESITLVKI
jgi:hypothetical protein